MWSGIASAPAGHSTRPQTSKVAQRNPTALRLSFLQSLIGSKARFTATVHPPVWTTAFNQPVASCVIGSFVNQAAMSPPLPIPGFGIELLPPSGRRIKRLKTIPEGRDVACELRFDGTLAARVSGLNGVLMLAAELA